MMDEKELSRLHGLKGALPKVDKMLVLLSTMGNETDMVLMRLLRQHLRKMTEDEFTIFKMGFLLGEAFKQSIPLNSDHIPSQMSELIKIMGDIASHNQVQNNLSK